MFSWADCPIDPECAAICDDLLDLLASRNGDDTGPEEVFLPDGLLFVFLLGVSGDLAEDLLRLRPQPPGPELAEDTLVVGALRELGVDDLVGAVLVLVRGVRALEIRDELGLGDLAVGVEVYLLHHGGHLLLGQAGAQHLLQSADSKITSGLCVEPSESVHQQGVVDGNPMGHHGGKEFRVVHPISVSKIERAESFSDFGVVNVKLIFEDRFEFGQRYNSSVICVKLHERITHL